MMARSDKGHFPVLVRGVGDVGSAVAVVLFRAGYSVVLHDDPLPTTSRRGMAFTDAVFDGTAMLDGVAARRVDLLAALNDATITREAVPITTDPLGAVLEAVQWSALVDARMRKHAVPECQCGLAPLTIGLGPNFIAGQTVDVAIETGRGERLGEIITSGPTLPLAGEPQPLGGVGRARFVYAPVAGRFATAARIGEQVAAGMTIATIGDVGLTAPLSGVVRGLTRSGVFVPMATKVIEIDPRGDPSSAFGLGERPRRIAEGVRQALANTEANTLTGKFREQA
jgi:xanthine dehydrogenase accessory factor